MIKGVLLGFFISLLCLGFYKAGEWNGVNAVVSDCSNYKKYKLGGTQELLCSAIIDPNDLMQQLHSDITDKYYSKENKDKHKKDRK